MVVFESRNGEHWKETHHHRPLEKFTRGDIFWFVLGHILLIPLALGTLAFTAICLPLYYLWARWLEKNPPEIHVHGEVKRITNDSYVNPAFTAGATEDANPDVTVIIPFYNRAEWVDRIIGSVLCQRLTDDTIVEIIAVDNGSTDKTMEKLQEYPVRIVECAERGPGHARDAGIAAARAPIIAFIDSDCVADTYWLNNIINPFHDPDVILAGGRIISMAEDDFVATFTDREHILDNERFFYGSGFFPRFFATANAACRRDAIVKIGGFDNSLYPSEDADLSWRIMDLGGKMAYIENAAIYHQHRHTLKALLRQSIDYGTGSVAIFEKHRHRLEATAALSWKNIRDIAWSPFNFIWDQIVAQNSFHRKRELLYALWRVGFTYGSVRECIRRRVLFI